jgi:hypothetical protein
MFKCQFISFQKKKKKKKKKRTGENKMKQGLNILRPLGLIIMFKKA